MKTVPTPPVVCDASQTPLHIYAPVPGTNIHALATKYFDMRDKVRSVTESIVERIRIDHFPYCHKDDFSYIASDATEEGGIIAVLPESSDTHTPDLSIWYPMPIADNATVPAASPADTHTFVAYAPRCKAASKYMPLSYADKHFNDKQWSWKSSKNRGIHIYYYKDIANLISPKNQDELSLLIRNLRPKTRLAYGIHYTDIDPEHLTFQGHPITDRWDPDRAIPLYDLFSDCPSVMSCSLLKLLNAHRHAPESTIAPSFNNSSVVNCDASQSSPIFEHVYSPTLGTYIFRTNLLLDPSLRDITHDPAAQQLFMQD